MKKIDKKDQKLLYELYRDGRASNTQLSSRIGISKEALAYRMKRLEKNEILKKVTTIVDVSAIGYEIYKMDLVLNKYGKERREQFVEYVKKLPEASWLLKTAGEWDYTIIFLAKSTNDFQRIYTEFLMKKGASIAKKQTATIFNITYLTPNYLIEGERLELRQEIKQKKYELDKIQENILNILEENARIPLIQIAKKLNVSITTIKYHLKILEKNKIIITYKPVLNLKKLGIETYKVRLEIKNPSQKRKVLNYVKENKHVVLIQDILGRYDLEYTCQYNNTKELLEYIDELDQKFELRKFEIIFDNEKIEMKGIPDYGLF